MTDVRDTCDGLDGPAAAPAALPPGVPALRMFYLYLTAGCNLHCRHCWITPTFVNGRPVPGECLDPERLRQAVAEAKPMGLSAAKLTGGEPTLHPAFREIVSDLSAAGLDLSLETNGTLLDREVAEHLRAAGTVTRVAVSLDSPRAEAHDAFRGVRGAFDAAVRGIGHLTAAGFRPQIIMSVHRLNRAQVEELIELAVRLGAGAVKFNPVTSSGRGGEMHRRGEALDFDETLDLIHQLRGPLQDRHPIHLGAMVPPALSTVRELRRYGGEGAGCNVRHILGILGTGEMALCGIGRNIPELCFGRLGLDDLREVWCTHPVLVGMRRDLAGPLPGVCGDCLHAGRCQTHCLAQNYEVNGRLVSVSPLCAEAVRRGVFPATRRRSWTPPGKTVRSGEAGHGLFLHASAVATESGALLFLGHSTSGKSTIVRLLRSRFPTLADDSVYATLTEAGHWQVVDGGFRFDGGGVAEWQESVRRRTAAGEGVRLAGCLRIRKSPAVRIAPLGELELAGHLMNAVMEIDLQRKLGRTGNAGGSEWGQVRDCRRRWFGQVAEIARACPGWELWFSRDAQQDRLAAVMGEVARVAGLSQRAGAPTDPAGGIGKARGA